MCGDNMKEEEVERKHIYIRMEIAYDAAETMSGRARGVTGNESKL